MSTATSVESTPRILRTREEVLAWRASLDKTRGTSGQGTPQIAFVPTMGFLHDGHLSLVQEGRARVGPDGIVIASIFVNPTQFAAHEDLGTYPRDEAGDLRKLASVGTDVAFCPLDPAEMYPRGVGTSGDGVELRVEVVGLSEMLCGVRRPTHFRGVATVVAKLLLLVRPDVSIFGQKDYQQLAVIRRLHEELFLSGEIIGMPIVREPDGLAMSSRNAYLSAEERAQATAIPRFMEVVKARFAVGERNVEALLKDAPRALEPGTIDYVEIRDARTLRPLERVDAPAVCAVAVFFGRARLLDNVELGPG